MNLDDIIVYEARPVPKPGLERNVWRVNAVLVEDNDNDADAELICSALRNNPKIGTLDYFSGPAEALKALKSARTAPTIIFLDIHMPKMSGFQFLEEVRRVDALRSVPVVFLTSSGFFRDVSQAQKTSACAYIIKPDDFNELKVRLDRVIEKLVVDKWRD